MKRKRGGQPGNQNARRHGFFSTELTPEQIQEFWDIIKKEPVAPEIALVRVKLLSALRYEPACPERSRRSSPLVLNEAAKLVAKWHAAQYGLDRAESRLVKKTFLAVLEQYTGASATDSLQSSGAEELLKKNESSVL